MSDTTTKSGPTTSLAVTDAMSQAAAVAPRVSLADIEAAISERHDLNVGKVLPPHDKSLDVLLICILVMKNGFSVIGKSAPASPENFNAELGAKFAYEDAVRQIWPLMGFALRETLAHG